MKKVFLSLLTVFTVQLFSQTPKVYINLNSHNEAAMPSEAYDGVTSALYDSTYKYVKRVADSVISKKAKYNFQSDVAFLLGCLKYDPKAAATGSLNLVKWMDNSAYIECDPHCHEAKYGLFFYNYSDCAHLHDSLGVTNRKNVGGFKVDGLQNGNYWLSFETGEIPKHYSTAIHWKPNVMWGGSYKTGVHNDMNTYGEWKPQDSINYGTHVPTRRLRLQGNGCEMHFTDTTNEQRIVNELRKIFTRVNNGMYPNTEFYTQSIQYDCRDVAKPNFVNRLCTIMDSVNKYVAKGWVEWKTITEKDQLWYAAPYDSAYKRQDCATLPTGIQNYTLLNGLKIYPNPTQGNLMIEGTKYYAKETTITLFNAIGILVKEIKLSGTNDFETIDLSDLSPGCYFINTGTQYQKIIKE